MAIDPHANLFHAEAKVQVRDFGTETWRDSIDFDPVEIPVEGPNTTDVFNSNVIGMVSALIEAETDGDSFTVTGPRFEYQLVWSGNGNPVMGVCPVCDRSFPVSEGAPGDELNEGFDAVFCGCTDEDAEVDFSDGNDDEIDFSDN